MLVYANVKFESDYGDLYRIVDMDVSPPKDKPFFVSESKLLELAQNNSKPDSYAIGLKLSDFNHVKEVIHYTEEQFKALKHNELPLKYIGETEISS